METLQDQVPETDASSARDTDLSGRLALAQGAIYIATGVWPIVSPGTFQLVTGPKLEVWLVKTMGGLITAVGAVLCAAGARGKVSREIRMLAQLSAATLATADVIYSLKGRISRVYLLDAALEGALLAGWAVEAVARRRGRARAMPKA
jgi:hypothetical protein